MCMSIVFSSPKLRLKIEKPSFWGDYGVPKIYSLFLYAIEGAVDHRDLCALSFLGLRKKDGENEYVVGCFEDYGVEMLVLFRHCISDRRQEELMVEGARKNG